MYSTVNRAFVRITRRCAVLFCLLYTGIAVAQSDRPNVLFIISDDLSAEALGAYGNTQCRTPNIDRLAQEGVRFTRMYTQFPICGPSRACLMSGLYPQQINVLGNTAADNFEEVMGDRPSLAEHFRLNGYHTARTSKIYHMRVPGDITAGVDGPDHAESWSERHNFQAPEWMSEGEHAHYSNEKLRKDPEEHYNLGFGGAFYVVQGSTDGSEQPDIRATDKAIEIMTAHKGEPFFMAVGLVRPHVPFVAPAKYFEPYAWETIQLPEKIAGDQDDIPEPGLVKTSESMGMQDDLEKQKKSLAAYYACVSFMDAQVGRLLDALDDLQLRENTIVVFTSDHGYHLDEHDLWQKVNLHEEGMRIPFIIDAPGHEPAVAEALAEQIDIYPTLSALAGLDTPEHCAGRSLVPALHDPAAVVRDDAYGLTRAGQMLRTVTHTYIRYTDGEEELYDMQVDPRQYTNLAGDPANADALNLLRQRLEDRNAAIENAR